MAPLPPLSSRPSVARAGIKVPLRWLFRMPGYLGPGSAAQHPRVALRAPEGKLVPGPRYGADPGMLRCARDDSRDTCEPYAIALPFQREEESAARGVSNDATGVPFAHPFP